MSACATMTTEQRLDRIERMLAAVMEHFNIGKTPAVPDSKIIRMADFIVDGAVARRVPGAKKHNRQGVGDDGNADRTWQMPDRCAPGPARKAD